MNYRKAMEVDSHIIAHLWAEHFDYHSTCDKSYKRTITSENEISNYFAKIVANSKVFLFIAENESEIVGFVLAEISQKPPCFVDRTYGCISDIAVTQSARNRGVAKNLLKFAMEWFKNKNITEIEAKVHLNNKLSTSFWNKTEFTPIMQVYKFKQN